MSVVSISGKEELYTDDQIIHQESSPNSEGENFHNKPSARVFQTKTAEKKELFRVVVLFKIQTNLITFCDAYMEFFHFFQFFPPP